MIIGIRLGIPHYVFLKHLPLYEGAVIVVRPVTNAEVLRAKALEKDLTLHDGDGLFLIVKTSGKKLWRFRYQRPATEQRTIIGLAAFPALSLADARGLRADYLALLANGINPQIQAEVEEEQQQIKARKLVDALEPIKTRGALETANQLV
jgi:hypothetical protein